MTKKNVFEMWRKYLLAIVLGLTSSSAATKPIQANFVKTLEYNTNCTSFADSPCNHTRLLAVVETPRREKLTPTEDAHHLYEASPLAYQIQVEAYKILII